MELKRVKLSDLVNIQGDIRTITDVKRKELIKNIKEGKEETVIQVTKLIDGRYAILDGNHRVEILKELHGDIETVVTLYDKELTEKQAIQKILKINEQKAKFELEPLELKLETLEIELPEMDDLMFQPIVDVLEDDSKITEDEAPALQEQAITILGDLYELIGENTHRVHCADSTDVKAVEKLMNGEKADMVFTDPPYGIEIVQNNQIGGGGAFGVGKEAKKGGKSVKATQYSPVIGDDSIDIAVGAISVIKTLEIKTQIIWGGNYYSKHLDNSNCWIVWDKETGSNTFADAELAWTNQESKVRIFKHQWMGMVKASEHGKARVHPTQKPIALAEWSFKNYGEPKSVLDLFLGSGSTLIACEQTNRNCYGQELDERYTDVCINRYVNYMKKNNKPYKIKRNGEIVDWDLLNVK